MYAARDGGARVNEARTSSKAKSKVSAKPARTPAEGSKPGRPQPGGRKAGVLKLGVLKLGVLGTGVAAVRLYLPALAQLRGKVEVVACCNRTRSKAEGFAERAGGARVVEDAEQLLTDREVDAVLISLPIELLPKYVKLALAHGKPVLSEKPLAPTVRSGQRLLEQTAGRRVPWLVGENFAFMDQVDALERWVRAGRLGQVRLIEVRQLSLMDENSAYFHTAWRQAPKHTGGFVVDGGVHLANVVRRCFGMPTEIKNLTAQFNPALAPLDTALAVLRFESGAVGTWTSCFSARYEGPMIRVFGEHANAQLDYTTAELLPMKGKPERVQAGDSFRAEFEHFYDVVKRGVKVRVSPEDALLDLRLVDALVRSR
jgi:predicted dehydrogenase